MTAVDTNSLRPDWLAEARPARAKTLQFDYVLKEPGEQVGGVSAGHLQAGDMINITIENNEMMLRSAKVDGEDAVPLDALGLSEKDKANMMAQAVFCYAENGYDPDSHVKAAACHVIEDSSHPQADGRPTQRIFIAANANHRARSQRFDAEANALAIAKNTLGVGNFMVKETFLTLHQPKAPGEIMTPCGTCREELTNKAYIAPDAMLYCIPFGELGGEQSIQLPDMSQSVFDIDDQSRSDSPESSETPAGHIFKQKTLDLVPYKNLSFPEEIVGRPTVDIMKEGRDWATNGKNDITDFRPLPIDQMALATLHQSGRSSEIPYLCEPGSDEPSLHLVNRFLANKIKAAYNNLTSREGDARVSPEDIRKIRASVIRLQTGECYASLYIDGEGLGAKPLGEMSALSNAFNPTNVNEVYVMEFNPVYMDERMEERGPNARAVYPEALDRIYKSTKHSEGEWARRTAGGIEERVASRCMISQIPLNDGSLSDEALEQATQKMSIQELYPGPYKAANSMTHGCC